MEDNKNISRSDEIYELLYCLEDYYGECENEGLIGSNDPATCEIFKRLIDLNVTAEDLKEYMKREYPDEC